MEKWSEFKNHKFLFMLYVLYIKYIPGLVWISCVECFKIVLSPSTDLADDIILLIFGLVGRSVKNNVKFYFTWYFGVLPGFENLLIRISY